MDNLSTIGNRDTMARSGPQFFMEEEDQQRLQALPWQVPLGEWPKHGVELLSIRRGESRHPVIFVEREGWRYAIKETTPHMAAREIRNLREIEARGIPVLNPVGSITVPAPPIRLGGLEVGGVAQYTSGDRGYTVTRLARRVIPHALLFRLPFSPQTNQRLLGAIAVLMVELHEHGIYWGDPSLANVLIRIDGRRVLAIMADAETTELFPQEVEERLRQQDLDLFAESLVWQAEDLRQARGIEEDAQEEHLLNERDVHYFERRYRWLRKEHARLNAPHVAQTLLQVERLLDRLNRLGLSLLGMGGHTLQMLISVTPGWYARRVHELLGIKIPPRYARRFYNTILGHQAIMSKKLGRDIPIEQAARDWYTQYHLPAMVLLRQILTSDQDPLRAYFAVMLHKWNLSVRAGREIPLEEALLDWAMRQARRGTLGPVDPAALTTLQEAGEPAIEALEPPIIRTEQMAALVAEDEKPLVKGSEAPLPEDPGKLVEQKRAENN